MTKTMIKKSLRAYISSREAMRAVLDAALSDAPGA